ncbi:M66 family metalloprotease [Pelomonas sp. SE-A7]|uniref:M66 family metalloprotease n=1 Tax=Pelomonas sp. SE-A7 TaxID=3054953 RepID=UPI00259C7FC4|nr:M66 family metalloprotease [Pelomonas sp. SE-A7]MDM4766121.1 M66 family metalloprotease [Pelomonas sp. SE-A7]
MQGKFKKATALSLAGVLAGLLAACGGGGGGGGGSSGSTVVVTPPAILTQPASAEAQRCEAVMFSVAASGTGPLSFQWQRNDQDIPGANKATLQVNAQAADDQARYSVIVSNSGGQTRSTAATLKVNPVDESKLSIASVELAQVMLVDAKDPTLELVQGREVLVKVNARAPVPMHCKPSGTLRIEDLSGQPVREIALNAPLLPIPSSTPAQASTLDSYSASVPAELVKPGLRLVVSLPGQSAPQKIAPAVSPSPAITLVVIPLQIADTVAQIPAGIPDYITARSPIQSLKLETRAVMRSQSLTAQPTVKEDWVDGLSKLLTEINQLRSLEGNPARTHYYGFVRQTVIGSNVGLGYRPGGAAVGYDRPEYPEYARETLQHELGHNFSLQHAPCGEPANPDTKFPYADARMGAGSRMVWGYNGVSKTFVDPNDANNHDLMSYCSGDWFSDYNYGKVLARLRTALPSTLPAVAGAQIAAAVESQTEPLLLISGEIGPRGLSLSAPRAFSGQAERPESGPFVLTLKLASGELRQWAFDAQPLEHAPQLRHFHFSIAHPGRIESLSIARDGQQLLRQAVVATEPRSAQQATATQLQAQLSGARLSLQWDGQRWPQLSLVKLMADGKRRLLSASLSGGKAEVEIGAGEALGYEIGLVDGLNSQLLWLDAAGRPQTGSPAAAQSRGAAWLAL